MAKNYIDMSAVVNSASKQLVNGEQIANLDTSDVVSVGNAYRNSGRTNDNIYDTIVDKVGEYIIANEVWSPKLLKMFRNSWDFGLLLEELRVRTVEAVDDPSQHPVSGQRYADSLTKYDAVDVVAKYYNSNAGFQLVHWRPEDQLWTAFKSNEHMQRFLDAIGIAIKNSMTKKLTAMAKACLGTMIARTMYKAAPAGNYGAVTGLLGVNIEKLYNDLHPGATVTAEQILNSTAPESFYRFAGQIINERADYLTDISDQFNIDGEEEQTTYDNLNVVLLSKFANAMNFNLYNAQNQFDSSLIKLPTYDTVTSWQATEAYDVGVLSEVMSKFEDNDGTVHTVEMTGVIGVAYDIRAVAITCERKILTSFYHPDLNQRKFFDKYSGGYLNNTGKNFIVFYVADAA